jgi:hypothetical protein
MISKRSRPERQWDEALLREYWDTAALRFVGHPALK